MKKILINTGLLSLKLISFLPISIINRIGSIVGTAGYYIAKKRKNIGIKNLSLCFPNLNETQKHKIIKEHFKYLMTSALEYGLLFFASKVKIRNLVKVKNQEIIDKYYKRQPIILLCPHFVGLDLAASRLSQDYLGCGIYSRQKNSYMSHKLKEARLRFMKDKGGEIFTRNNGLRPIIKKLRSANPIFYYLPDQDFGERDSVYVPFFAHPHCATVNILPRLVTLTNAVVIPMAVYKTSNHYEITLLEAWKNYPSDNLYKDIIKINQFIEYAINKHIAQYFWLHKRFKSQPNLEHGSIYSTK